MCQYSENCKLTSCKIRRTYQKSRARASDCVSSLVLKFTIPTGFLDTSLFAILAVWTTLLAATTAMISNPHVALNRERKGGIAKFIVVGSETKTQTVSGKKVAKAKHG